ncbi:MAG: ATP-binding protein [Chloroflexi bacterium]|nr:ATP-binding protein [Chloroflexota bacterium]
MTERAASQNQFQVFCSLRLRRCLCGYYGDVGGVKQCGCPPTMVSRYQKRISGPLLDRIDVFVDVPRIEYEKLADDRLGEKGEVVRGRVEAAREIQRQRFAGLEQIQSQHLAEALQYRRGV